VVARTKEGPIKIRARTVLLAAGALQTPILLLNSHSSEWPKGLGNRNDLVGRCLMFHCSDTYLLSTRKRLSGSGPRKTLSSRAFYSVNGLKLGSFQSLGVPISQSHIFEFLTTWLDLHLSWRLPLARLFMRVLSVAAAKYYQSASIFATIIEDFPYFINRVVPDDKKPSGFYIEYTKAHELSHRISLMRIMLKNSLAPHKPIILSGNENLNFGHPSGTCRFGSDPATSVLDPTNKVRDVDNIYVVDASFFPSSGGTNPSLTIAANALRVADLITSRLKADAPAP
jgi:choline dehydrogenase-like flavoprotein